MVSSSYNRLKTVKFWRFVRSRSFLQICSHLSVEKGTGRGTGGHGTQLWTIWSLPFHKCICLRVQVRYGTNNRGSW